MLRNIIVKKGLPKDEFSIYHQETENSIYNLLLLIYPVALCSIDKAIIFLFLTIFHNCVFPNGKAIQGLTILQSYDFNQGFF